jgi:hypothetical protein
MPVNWTNNFNDTQSDTVITAKVKVNHAIGEGTVANPLDVDNLTRLDHDGGLNWRAGDEFTITNVTDDDDATLYSITSITAGDTDYDADTVYSLVISPVLAFQADNNGTLTKEDSYKGNQGSAENHLRLRNLGHI